jgi:DNA-binding NtrC family response regulator
MNRPADGKEEIMGKQIQLLIVDDDPVTREMMRGFFLRKRYFVFLAENGEEALHILGEEEIDLVITDYQMPVMGGKELIRRIYKSYPRLPVILTTGWRLCGVEEASLLKRLFDFFIKPVDLAFLEMSVAKALGEPRISEREERLSNCPAKSHS